MNFARKSLILPLLAPTALLFASVVLLPFAAKLTVEQRLGLVQVPYYLLALNILLGLGLNRTREVSTAIVLAAVYFSIQRELQLPLEQLRPGSVYFLLCLFVPLTITVLSVMPDGRLFEYSGMASLALAPVILVVGLRVLDQTLNSGGTLNDIWLPRPEAPTILSTEAFYLFSICIAICLVAFFARRSAVQIGLLFSLIFCFVTLNWLHLPMISTVMILSGGLALFWGLIASLLGMLYQDELTGLADRKALNKAMSLLREGDVLVMADVDKFKNLNDTHGHDTGDEVLKLVAATLDNVGERGKAYRYGGEEFTLLFRGRDSDLVLEELNRLRAQIADYPIVLRARENRAKNDKAGASYRQGGSGSGVGRSSRKAIKTSISMGAVILRGDEHPADALKRADKQLYRAKKAGRDRVCSDFR